MGCRAFGQHVTLRNGNIFMGMTVDNVPSQVRAEATLFKSHPYEGRSVWFANWWIACKSSLVTWEVVPMKL